MTLRSHHYTAPRLRRPVRSEPLRGANGGLDAGGASVPISTATPPAWLHRTRANDTTLRAWRSPRLGADAGCCSRRTSDPILAAPSDRRNNLGDRCTTA